MAGLSQAAQQAALTHLCGSGTGHQIEYSVNGTSAWAGLAATAVTWSSPTAATPSEVSNTAALTTAAATAAGTVTHVRAVKSGLVITDWQALTVPRALQIGDRGEHAAGAIKITLD